MERTSPWTGSRRTASRPCFLATGLHGGRALNVPGEDADGVIQGVDFLRDTALGKDVQLGERVVVIGGGNVAIDVSLVARRLGAKSVRQVCLESREEMPAWDYEVQEALESEIDIVNCFGPKGFRVENGKVAGLEFMACTCVFDEQGRFNPQYDSEDCTAMEADTVIVAIGQSADLSYADGQGVSVTSARRAGSRSRHLADTPWTGSLRAGIHSTAPKAWWTRWPAAKKPPKASTGSSTAWICSKAGRRTGPFTSRKSSTNPSRRGWA